MAVDEKHGQVDASAYQVKSLRRCRISSATQICPSDLFSKWATKIGLQTKKPLEMKDGLVRIVEFVLIQEP